MKETDDNTVTHGGEMVPLMGEIGYNTRGGEMILQI